VPAGLDEVAVVEHVGAVVREAAVWPFTNPEYDAVMVGGVLPYELDVDDAVMAREAGPTLTEPPT